ncbi:MAG: sulfite oxidase [Verrucomicrobia bacterium]|jgi:sulfite oxidase|nr:sulfite oxidase [Verrucomicrobiota bacterium]
MKTSALDQNLFRSNRRRFLAGLATVLGAPLVFQDRLLQTGLFPSALAQEALLKGWPGKEALRMLSDKPLNAEATATLLDDEITPNSRHFVRNNGLIPDRALRNELGDWSLTVDGEVDETLKFDLNTLKDTFSQHEAALVIECGGNGRAGYFPKVGGNPWTLGAVGCARYRGVRLRDVLRQAGVKSSAVYIGYYGEDPTLSREPGKYPISRGVPIEKALDEHTMLAWEMNGAPLPAEHGFPLRLICPGWPGSTSGKWVKRIQVRDQIHDGTKMVGTSYRVPKHPVAPGTKVPTEDMEIIQTMPVKSIITHPETGSDFQNSKTVNVRGHAWSGNGRVTRVDLSYDFGATWQRTSLSNPVNAYAWQRWESGLELPIAGYYEIWARATDANGQMQPMVVPGWNPKGYLNNAVHRISVRVA